VIVTASGTTPDGTAAQRPRGAGTAETETARFWR
jgi:hypothetical protein